jgi:hypothetical protein
MGHPTFADEMPQLEWIGPLAFARQHPDSDGSDLLLGDTWGPRVDQSIFWRQDPHATTGTLCAFDPLWDEYTVLATNVGRDRALDAYLSALRDPRANTVERLAVLARHRQRPRPVPVDGASWEPQL